MKLNVTRFAAIPAATAISIFAAAGAHAGDFDNFNDGKDTGWNHFDLNAVFGSVAHYSFPPDGHGGLAYRLKADVPPVNAAGPARIFSYLSTSYSRVVASVDVLDWNNGIDQAIGFLFRANSIGLGTTVGYVMNYNVTDGNLQFNTVDQEAAVSTIAEVHIPMDPVAHDYRWVLSTYGPNLLGQVFQLPDTNNPIASVVATDDTTPAGPLGLLIFDRSNAENVGADATFDNYSAAAPAAGTLAAITEALVPAPGAAVAVAQPTIQVAVLDRETTVDRSSFSLSVDGASIPSGQLTVTEGVTVPNNAVPFAGPTLTFVPASPLSPGAHQITSIYSDSGGAHFTNTWTFTAAYLSTPVAGTGQTPGFNVFVVQAPQNPGLANSLARAENQLATNTIPRLYATNVTDTLINYSSKALDGGSDGTFTGDAPIPGQIDDQTFNNWAMQVTTYLSLPVGLTTLGVQCDDGYSVSSGGVVLGSHNGGPANETFQFYVAQAGLYPFRLVWYQSGGAAFVEWFSMAASGHDDTGGRVLLNDPNGGIPAFATVSSPAPTLLSATTVGGPYQTVAGATPDTSAQTFTLSIDAGPSTQFYRVSADTAVNVDSAGLVSGKLVIHYTM
jgi:hypothetical protein